MQAVISPRGLPNCRHEHTLCGDTGDRKTVRPQAVAISKPDIQQTRQAMYRGADKSLARPGRKQATATEGFVFHISYL